MDSNIGSYLLSHNFELRLLFALLSIVGGFALIKASLALISLGNYLQAIVRPYLNINSHPQQISAAGAR